MGRADSKSRVEKFNPQIGEILASSQAQDPVERLRGMIGERQEETVEILRGWLEDKEEKV